MLGNKGLADQAAEHARLAYELRREVSEYERLYIESTYHSLVTGDHQQRVGTLKVLTQTYPRDYAAHNNLANTYMVVGDWDAALSSARRATELAPDERTPVGNLAQILF